MMGTEKTNPIASAGFDTSEMLAALIAVRKGDFSARLPNEWTGVNGKIADVFNGIVEMNQRLARELERVGKVAGKEGKLTQRINLKNGDGAWNGMEVSFNTLLDDLVRPTAEMSRVIGAVAKGDLNQSMSLEVEGRQLQGEFLRTSKTVNAMVQQLSSFASEVTRVAREVGTDGKLGGQALTLLRGQDAAEVERVSGGNADRRAVRPFANGAQQSHRFWQRAVHGLSAATSAYYKPVWQVCSKDFSPFLLRVLMGVIEHQEALPQRLTYRRYAHIM